jgi:hypothetical protein
MTRQLTLADRREDTAELEAAIAASLDLVLSITLLKAA